MKGPLMLYMGVHPLVASATCAVMIMFTSVAATTMFIAFGTLIWDYGIFLFIIGEILTSFAIISSSSLFEYTSKLQSFIVPFRTFGHSGWSVRSELLGAEVQASVAGVAVHRSRGGHFHCPHGLTECV